MLKLEQSFGCSNFFPYICNMGILLILLLMILCHVIDDFVLQPICLSKLKQEKWWKQHEEYKDLYKNDYKVALLIHSMSWSIMVMLPIIFFVNVPQINIFLMFVLNTFIHYLTDDEKANKGTINLVTDQGIHFTQILMAWSLCWGI